MYITCYPKGTENIHSFLAAYLFSLNITKISPTVNDVFARLNSIEHYIPHMHTHVYMMYNYTAILNG